MLPGCKEMCWLLGLHLGLSAGNLTLFITCEGVHASLRRCAHSHSLRKETPFKESKDGLRAGARPDYRPQQVMGLA
jgi:hypothetical protein